ncbi:rhodanese-like domain-containing protein [Paracoccus sanguinis]|uniref:rhodanese-like domain-containing protein n=1 Tax=Paracoccus sanguinis TaxID=1545044 RepID=UPI001452566D|nr:rhodanese-like domain-containing protein [Paracoccus sanguinis]QJD16842.1 PQQ-dependent catabolism-associated CXXCW motif protein [Paracoccus sanguinis]
MIRRAAALACLLAGLGAAAAADPAVPEPQGYRGEPYRAPVPDTLAGATVLDAAGTADWQAQGAVLIDVLPATRRPAGLPAGTLWRAPVHETLPGAVWLADTGYDRLAPEVERGFVAALERLSHGDRGAALVFFCKADCWMSWNAARRAVALGYGRVGWFPGGTDAWAAEGRALVPAVPAD